MSQGSTEDRLSQIIAQLIEEKDPENTKQLVALVREKTGFSEERIVDQILRLQSEGKITFRKSPQPEIRGLSVYLQTTDAYWYWIVIVLAITTVIVVFTVPEDAYPIAYLRYGLGIVFVLWMPGYSLVKALFPSELPLKTSTRNLDAIERIALSIGISITLVPIVGFLLNYTPWGIRLVPTALSLLGLTAVSSTAAVVREYQTKSKNPQDNSDSK